jgi:hypothetical protein
LQIQALPGKSRLDSAMKWKLGEKKRVIFKKKKSILILEFMQLNKISIFAALIQKTV